MACGRCGKRNKQNNINIYREEPKYKTTINQTTKHNMVNTISNIQSLCNICKTPLHITNKFDTSTRIVVKQFVCSNPQCSNKGQS